MMTALDRAAVSALMARPDLVAMLAALDDPGEETRIVGGAIRNTLIGRPVTDIDLATTALPRETMRRARSAGLKAVPTGIAHGTVTVIAKGRPFEVTTLRQDIETDGRHAVVRFGRDFAADAARRDFTVNALSAGRDGEVHDSVGGLADLAAGRVRFIGDAGSRIREDYLRILRFFRFSADYAQGPIDPEGLAAAIRERHGLVTLSRERVRTELLKLFGARRAVETIAILSESGLAQLLVGAVGEHGRLGRAAALSEPPDPLLRLGAFAVLIREDAARLRDGLRLSNAEAARLEGYAALLSRLKSLQHPIDEAETRRLAVEHNPVPLRDTLAVLAGEPRPGVLPEAASLLARFTTGEQAVPVFPLRAAELIARGVPAGRRLGAILAAARAEWLARGCPPTMAVEAWIKDEA